MSDLPYEVTLEDLRYNVIACATVLAQQWEGGNKGWLVSCVKASVNELHEALDKRHINEPTNEEWAISEFRRRHGKEALEEEAKRIILNKLNRTEGRE